MGRTAKFNYDDEEFYKEIERLATQGYADNEIAYYLSDKFGETLYLKTFSEMKNGHYKGWTKEQNEKRGEKIREALSNGRVKINSIVRAKFLRTAIGGGKTKNVTRKLVQARCDCGGNSQCKICYGTGWVTLNNEVEVQETEFEQPPSLQAMSTWLFHHDPEWRKVQKGTDEETADVPQNIEKGVDIEKWLKIQLEKQEDDQQSNDNNGAKTK